MPRRSSLYTVSFVTPAGEEIVSRFFSRIANARKYARWLISRPSMASSAKIYRGEAGGELLEVAA
jgi:hypothetical protein